MKDVPADLPPGFTIGAVLTRADARDALVTKGGVALLEDLPQGARLGTSSLRRQAQLRALRPDLKIEALRGNVDTRLRKLDEGGMHAIVLACAGLIRLGLESRITARLDPKLCLPAVTQGIIGIECRDGDSRASELLLALEDPATRLVMQAERAFSRRLGGSCQSPIAAYAELHADRIELHGLVAEPDGSRLLRDTLKGSHDDPEALGLRLAERLLAAGAGPLLERLRTG
jgi:hydroxymethylbilane synthase